jgi:hypothetical protein
LASLFVLDRTSFPAGEATYEISRIIIGAVI